MKALILPLASILTLPLLASPVDQTRPSETDLVEKVESRLVQLDVTMVGDPDVIESLTPDDFRLKLGLTKIRDFKVDRLCREPSAGPESPPRETPDRLTIPAPRLAPTTYLFYFDQTHLTGYGRQRGLDLVRSLVPELITGGNRGMIVSNADEIATVADMTTDPGTLLDALDRLERDRDQWHLFATQEEGRVVEVIDALRVSGVHHAKTLATLHLADELWMAERDLRRFAMVLTRLATVDPPKAAIYLADTMRSNAGEHYIRLFGSADSDFANEVGRGQHLGAMLSFDRVVNEAASHAIRLYTIQAEGLVASSSRAPSRSRTADAQNTLASFAMETGGRHFLNGVSASRIAGKILEDLSCLHLISFPPGDLRRDVALPVKLRVRRPGVAAQVRGRVVIQSESARLTSRLLSAFVAPADTRNDVAVRPILIPTGYRDGSYSALVQVAVPGSEIPASTWDLGASVTTQGKVHEASGRFTVDVPGAPVVLQEPMIFAPGPYEIVAVAYNATSDGVASSRIEGIWPKPISRAASVGPIAVLQPARAAIRRQDRVRTFGAVAYAEDQAVRTDRPTALVGLVCRGRDRKGALRVERSLVGETRVAFPITDVDLDGDDRCALIRDIIPPSVMSAGGFSYEIRLLDSRGELARGQRRFLATSPAGP